MCAKKIENVANPFSASLSEAYRLLSYVNSKVDTKDVTVTNYNVQSIGNRVSSHKVECSVELVTGEKESVTLHDWQPARDGAGYNGEAVNAVKRNSGLVWEKAATLNFKDVNKESLSWLAYFIDGLLTGCVLSGESGFKIGIIYKAYLSIWKIKSLNVRIWRSALQEVPFEFTYSDIKSLINGLMPRWKAIDSIKEKVTTRKSQSAKSVSF